ncbi:MAG: site-specific integrase [Muribaculaceae bacterium]|nr:site-specific integrase [Muribaculaceae bacterium]
MKKKFQHTTVVVKLRKNEYHNEWYLLVESYPVYDKDVEKPKRVREYVNRTITTPVWDKKSPTRGGGFQPKRDTNGIIMCKSPLDQESCIYADKIRQIRQREYDTASLYSEQDAAQAELVEKSNSNFIDYVKKITVERHRNSSSSILINWKRMAELLKIFSKDGNIPFGRIDTKLINDFRNFLLTAPQGGGKSGTLSQNSAATYFSIFKAALKQAFVDGYISVDLAAKAKGIAEKESRREFLTIDELNILAKTPCDNPIIKRAALFAALTGLRHSDIKKLKWENVQQIGNQYRLNFTQQKTKGVEYMPISEQAYKLCGERGDNDRFIFEDLPDPSWISRPLKRWIESAGITRRISFHCFRHTFATLQIAGGTDLYTVSKMLGHTNVRTTQIYAKVMDKQKDEAANVINLDMTFDV